MSRDTPTGRRRAWSACSTCVPTTGSTPRADRLGAVIESALARRYAILEGEARRALGAVRRDPAELTAAVEILDRCGAVPYAARARAERALITGDEADLDAAVAVLETVGDAEQIERFQAARPGGP